MCKSWIILILCEIYFLLNSGYYIYTMGIERDYLMRQLMMLFDVIQKILRYRKKGDIEQAEEQIKYFYTCLKIDDDVEQLSTIDLLELLQTKKELSNEHIELVAFVLKEQGELQTDENRQTDFFQKSYFLLEKVERESTSFSMDRQMKLAELKQYLN